MASGRHRPAVTIPELQNFAVRRRNIKQGYACCVASRCTYATLCVCVCVCVCAAEYVAANSALDEVCGKIPVSTSVYVDPKSSTIA